MDVQNLKQWVVDRPVVVEIEADTKLFQFYKSGILRDTTYNECGQYISHKILLVGYNDIQVYWRLKNNWGSDWGEAGFVRIGQKDAPGFCGMLQRPVTLI